MINKYKWFVKKFDLLKCYRHNLFLNSSLTINNNKFCIYINTFIIPIITVCLI